MKDIQSIFNNIKEKQKEQRVIRESYRNVLSNSQPYQDILEKLKVLKEKKKSMEDGFKSEMRSEFDQLESIKIDLQTDREMLSDIALTKLLKGETIEVIDQHDNKYEPQFVVKFKKV